MTRLMFLCLPCLAVAEVFAANSLDLGNWMGNLEPILGNATLLDLSLPGAHDAMTYDLSSTLSEGYEGMGPVISKILHTVTPLVAGKFIREQGQTQGLNITSMLDGGVRFVDFRIMFTETPGTVVAKKDWYCLHGCQTSHKAIEYLRQVRTWLDAHPKEIVVFWASRHGNSNPTGTEQYPGTTPEDRQAFFNQVLDVFGGLLFDASLGLLNETAVTNMWERGQQVVWYAADYVESTNSSPLALDARLINNHLPGAGKELSSLHEFRSAASILRDDKAKNHFYLMSLASSAPTCQIEAAALITFVKIGKQRQIQKCAQCLDYPDMDNWCPMSLQENGQLVNYYNQLALETAYAENADDSAVDFPNAIYIDGIDVGGRIRTGTELLNHLTSAADDDHKTTGYAYSATVVGATVRRLCRRGGEAITAPCASLQTAVKTSRALFPLQRWNDTEHGRLDNWPLVLPRSPVATIV